VPQHTEPVQTLHATRHKSLHGTKIDLVFFIDNELSSSFKNIYCTIVRIKFRNSVDTFLLCGI